MGAGGWRGVLADGDAADGAELVEVHAEHDSALGIPLVGAEAVLGVLRRIVCGLGLVLVVVLRVFRHVTNFAMLHCYVAIRFG
ncbi:hypothetical protein HJ581_0045710 [Rhodococcus opacus]|nr:hypothetical protein HJ581_0045710 [Rhodococcus opacus]